MAERDTTAMDITQPEPVGKSRPASAVDFDRMSEEETMAFVDAFLNRLSLEGLSAIIDRAQEKRQERQEDRRIQLLERWRQEAGELGLDFDALFPGPTRRGRSGSHQAPIAAKYCGPKGETWSGRGHPPRWLRTLEQAGHHREEFRIQAEVG